MTSRTSGRLVPMISLRVVDGSSATSMPAAFSNGTISSKMRPFGSANVITSDLPMTRT